MNNHWCSYDSTDPVRVWSLAAPLPATTSTTSAAPTQRGFVAAALTACADTGVVCFDDGDGGGDIDAALARVARAGAGGVVEWLPFEDALFAGDAVPFASRVFVRVGSAIVARTSNNAGALLRELEQKLDDAYLRRFAAAHPFVGAFTTSTATTVRLSLCFFTSLPFDETDAALFAANQAPLLALRERLVALARAHGGTLDAKLTR